MAKRQLARNVKGTNISTAVNRQKLIGFDPKDLHSAAFRDEMKICMRWYKAISVPKLFFFP
jgi:hypothetical protein